LERASAQSNCRKIWQFRAASRPRAERVQYELSAAKMVQKHYIVGHENLRTKLLGQGVAANMVSTKRVEYLRSDPIPSHAKFPLLRIDVSVTWSVSQMQKSGQAWFDLAVCRGGRVEQQHMFCELQWREEDGTQSGPQTHLASWHVEKGLMGAAGDDKEYGPHVEKQQRIIALVKSLRIGDCVAIIPLAAGPETVQVVEEAEVKIYYED